MIPDRQFGVYSIKKGFLFGGLLLVFLRPRLVHRVTCKSPRVNQDCAIGK